MRNDLQDEIIKAIPGTIGALVALRWLGGGIWHAGASFIGGSAGAYYGAPFVSNFTGTSESLTGFLVGLFGMAIASRVFEALSVLNVEQRLEKLLARLGL